MKKLGREIKLYINDEPLNCEIQHSLQRTFEFLQKAGRQQALSYIRNQKIGTVSVTMFINFEAATSYKTIIQIAETGAVETYSIWDGEEGSPRINFNGYIQSYAQSDPVDGLAVLEFQILIDGDLEVLVGGAYQAESTNIDAITVYSAEIGTVPYTLRNDTTGVTTTGVLNFAPPAAVGKFVDGLFASVITGLSPGTVYQLTVGLSSTPIEIVTKFDIKNADQHLFSTARSDLYQKTGIGKWNGQLINPPVTIDGTVTDYSGNGRHGKLVGSPCITLAAGEILLYPSFGIIPDISLVDSVVNDGTATLTLDKPNRRLIATAGTCWNIRHLDAFGNILGHNPCSEGSGAVLSDVKNKTLHYSFNLGTGVLDAVFNWTVQNEYTYNHAYGANKGAVLYEQEKQSTVDSFFLNAKVYGASGPYTLNKSTGTVGGRDNVQILELVPDGDGTSDWRIESSDYFDNLGLLRLLNGFNIKITFDYYASGQITDIKGLFGSNKFIANTNTFVSGSWAQFSATSSIRSLGYHFAGTANVIGVYIPSLITGSPSQVAFDNFKIEIINLLPAVDNQDVLGNPLDPDSGKKMFDFGESLNRYYVGSALPNVDESFDDLPEATVGTTQYVRYEPQTPKKSDLLYFSAGSGTEDAQAQSLVENTVQPVQIDRV